MKTETTNPPRLDCCRCSQAVPEDEPIAVCACCGRNYCLWCYAAAILFWRQDEERVNAALAKTPGRCIEDLFEVIDALLLEDQLGRSPAPPRDKRH